MLQPEMALVKLVQCLFLGSAGIFAGLGATLNLAVVPALLTTTDPLPAWKKVYGRGKNIAFVTILTSASTALYLFFSLGDPRFFLSGALNFVVIPYTVKFMVPTNDALFAMKPGRLQEEKRVISKWGVLQWVRTTLSISAFALGLLAAMFP